MIGTCEICEKANTRVVLDHDHSTGMVRGYLCPRCNRALVSEWENKRWREMALKHLDKKTNQPYKTAVKATIGPRTPRKHKMALVGYPTHQKSNNQSESVNTFDKFMEDVYEDIGNGSGSLTGPRQPGVHELFMIREECRKQRDYYGL